MPIGTEPRTDPLPLFCDENIKECVDCLETGDTSGDGKVNLQDFASYVECATGPVGPQQPPAYPSACRCLDADDDGDIDLLDFGELQRNFTG